MSIWRCRRAGLSQPHAAGNRQRCARKKRHVQGRHLHVDRRKGQRHNKDGSEACYEEATGKKSVYSKPRYDDIIIMDPAAYDWVSESAEGRIHEVARHIHRAEYWLGFVLLDEGAIFAAGMQPSIELLFLSKGAVSCRRQRVWRAIRVRVREERRSNRSEGGAAERVLLHRVAAVLSGLRARAEAWNIQGRKSGLPYLVDGQSLIASALPPAAMKTRMRLDVGRMPNHKTQSWRKPVRNSQALVVALASLIAARVCLMPAHAQDYPNQPIKVIIPNPPADPAMSLRAPLPTRRPQASASPSSSIIGQAPARQSARHLWQKPSPTGTRSLACPRRGSEQRLSRSNFATISRPISLRSRASVQYRWCSLSVQARTSRIWPNFPRQFAMAN